jgi:hypothetical protein
MRRLSRRTLLAWAGLGVAVPACISPTLPLPPPSVPDGSDVGNGTYRLVGALPLYALVLVRNERTELVTGKGPLTDYDLLVAAEKGDDMTLWYETQIGEISSPILFQIDRLTPILDEGTGSGNPPVDGGPVAPDASP